MAQKALANPVAQLALPDPVAPVDLQALCNNNMVSAGMALADTVLAGRAFADEALVDTASIRTVRNSCRHCTHLYFYRNYSRITSTLNHF